MNFARWMTASVCALAAWLPSAALSQEPGGAAAKSPQNILSAVPADAWAVVCTPSVAQLDQKLTSFAQQLQLPIMGSPIALAKMMTGIMAGFDDNGGLAVVLLPTENMTAFSKSMVFLLPVSDYDAMLAPLAPAPAENGMSKLTFMEKETYVARFGKFAALAQTPDALTAVVGAKTSLREKLEEVRTARIEKDDLTVWLNLRAFTASQMYQGIGAMLALGGGDPEMFKQFDTAALSLRFDPAGLNLGLHIDADPDSEMGKGMSKITATSEPLLKGLPKDPFVVALGGVTNEAAGKQSVETLDKMLAKIGDQGGAEQKAVLDTIRGTLGTLAGELREFCASIAPLGEGEDGMVSLSVVITTAGDSKKIPAAIKETLEKVKVALAENPDASGFLKLVEYKSEAEKLSGATVDHLKVTLPVEAGSEEMKNVEKVIGKDAALIRLAMVDDTHVVVTLGGGAARATKVIEAAKSKQSPLSEDEGIKKVAANVPQKRSSEVYLSVDRLVKLAMAIGEACGSPAPVKFEIPELNAPIAMVQGPVGKAGSQTEVFVPMELMKTAKDIIMAQMMAPPPGQDQPAGDEQPDEAKDKS